jgi:hypothetical protein
VRQGGRIERFDFDGNSRGVVIVSGLPSDDGVALESPKDPAVVYYSNKDTNELRKINSDRTGDAVVLSGFGTGYTGVSVDVDNDWLYRITSTNFHRWVSQGVASSR